MCASRGDVPSGMPKPKPTPNPKPDPGRSRSASIGRILRQACASLAAAALFLAVSSGFAAEPSTPAPPPPPPLPPLTTASGSPRLPGKFVWADLVTDDLAAAQNFYGRLFGWTFRDVG